MATDNSIDASITAFIKEWQGDDQPMRERWQGFYELLKGMDGLGFEFVGRPGVSYSLRPKHVNQADRAMFAMVDVIDDDPASRWLSVCFYGDMITDPEERGEVIPGGLAGSDGYCFDMYEDDAELGAYISARLSEAAANAAKG